MVSRGRFIVYIVLIIITVLALLFLYNYRDKISRIAAPFILAAIISYLFHPVVIWLESRNIPRKYGILLIYLVFSVLVVTVMVFIVPVFINSAKELANTLPDMAAKYEGVFNKLTGFIKSSNWPSEFKNAIFREIQNGTAFVQNYISDILKKALSVFIETVSMLFNIFLSMVIAYYFLKDAGFFRESVLSIVPRKWRNWMIGTGREINSILSNFIQGQLLTALIVGVLEIIGLVIVGAKYALVLGTFGGIANVIPYFGPVIGAIPAVAIALIESPVKAVWTALVFIIVQQLDNNFISPRIIEGRVGLHPVTTIFAVLVGETFFGIPGMLIAVPVTGIIKVILKRAVDAIV
ncbi:MAG TPA: AI-2E family transporter [Clostridiaceae bacterium]|nr:AI-2E family transporter [Clostridiaceae bacterium]